MSAVETLKTKQTEFLQKRREFMDAMQKEIRAAFAELFVEHPELKQITWVAYTPYFNDGEPCLFSVHEIIFSTNPEECGSPYDHEGTNLTKWRSTYPGKAQLEEFASILSSARDVLLDMFGDHVMVCVTPEGIKVSEYDHE